MDTRKRLIEIHTCHLDELENILPRIEGESEHDYRCRCMCNQIDGLPQKFQRIYTQYTIQDSNLLNVLISLSLSPKQDVVKNLMNYNEGILYKFLHTISTFAFRDTSAHAMCFIISIGRALYHINKKSYRRIHSQFREIYVETMYKMGMLTEAIYADDEKTFDECMLGSLSYQCIINTSTEIGSTKYILRFLNLHILDSSKCIYLSLIRETGSVNSLILVLKAVLIHSQMSVEDLFNLVFIESFSFFRNNIILYQAFYILALSVEKITKMIDGKDFLTHSFLEWRKIVEQEDV